MRPDPTAWVDTHGDALFRYAMLRVRNRDLAEELVQECFLAALDARERFGGQSTERTWLIGILKRKIVDGIRSRVREQDHLESEAPAFFKPRGIWNLAPRRWSGDPSASVQDGEFWLTVQDCLHKLPAGLSETFMLRELDQIDGTEICELLGIAPTSLWQRLHRARLALRHCLETHWFGAPRTERPRS